MFKKPLALGFAMFLHHYCNMCVAVFFATLINLGSFCCDFLKSTFLGYIYLNLSISTVLRLKCG